jgi:Sigma-70, region 4
VRRSVRRRRDGDWGQHEALQDAIDGLTDRERRIIEGRHLANDPTTLSELGVEFGVSLQRVQQIEVGALEKMKTAAAEVATAKAARYAHGLAKHAFEGLGNRLSRAALNYRTEFEAISAVVAPYRGRSKYQARCRWPRSGHSHSLTSPIFSGHRHRPIAA